MSTPKVDTAGLSGYLPTIGIECHVQLKTRTKLFAAVDNDAREAEPNTLVSHICFGLPGALPVLNSKVLELASRAAFALNTSPQKYSYFERKHYFYPDLPKGYQISQLSAPIVVGGYVEIEVDSDTSGETANAKKSKKHKVQINRVQIEEDAGKNTHPTGKDYSLVDLNRAGTPLLEIVSEPDIHSAAEAKAYARELYLLMKYADVSDVNLYYGNMRFDVNVSVSKDPATLGLRSETKNLNSFRSVEKAVEYEVKRQIDLLEHGHRIVQETRGWDDAKQKTFSQRSKEDAHDYRYMPEPDVPPIELDDKYIERIRAEMPELPGDLRSRFRSLGLDSSQVETLIDEPDIALFVRNLIDAHGDATAKTIANWLTGEVVRLVGDESITWTDVLGKQAQLVALTGMLSENKLSSTAAKEVLAEVLTTGADPQTVAETKNLLQESDEGALVMIVQQVLSDNPKAADDVRNGEMKAIGFLVGQVMKASRGKANPQVVQQLIKQQLGV